MSNEIVLSESNDATTSQIAGGCHNRLLGLALCMRGLRAGTDHSACAQYVRSFLERGGGGSAG
jgi:hypothetical protein